MDIASLNHVYDAAMEWNREEINDDREVHIACESVQSICQGILSTMDELLTINKYEALWRQIAFFVEWENEISLPYWCGYVQILYV